MDHINQPKIKIQNKKLNEKIPTAKNGICILG